MTGWAEVFAGGGPLLHLAATPGHVARHRAPGIQYLASPYTRLAVGPDGAWSPVRSAFMAGQAAVECERLRRVGVTAISPIVLADRMVRDGGVASSVPPVADPLDVGAWEEWCRPLLFACRSVIVPDIPGWHLSEGVWREVAWALQVSVPVFVYADRLPEAAA